MFVRDYHRAATEGAFTIAAALALAGGTAALAAKDEGPVKVTAAKSIAGTQKVVVGQFTVGFLTERRDTKTGSGLLGSNKTSSSMFAYLDGYNPADFQKVADAAYDDFVAKLTAQGFTVVDRAGFAADSAVAASPSEASPFETSTITGKEDKAKLIMVGASQTGPLRMLAGDTMRLGFGAYAGALNGPRVLMAQQAWAKANNVRVLDVVYMVNFASAVQKGNAFGSSVKTTAGLELLPEQSKVTVVGEKGTPGVVAIQAPVEIEGDFFTSANALTTGDKVGKVAGAVLGGLMKMGGFGGGSNSDYNKVRFTAKPGVYTPGAVQLTQQGNTVLTQQLAALR